MNPEQLFRHEADPLLLKAGETLFRCGDEANEMFVLLEGQAEIEIDGQVMEISEPGALIGEMAIIDGSPRTATVSAKTDCKLARVSQKRFTFLVQQTPFFAIQVMRVLAERLRGMNQRVARK